MNAVALLGTAATVYGVWGAVAILLQARKIVLKQESCDISLPYMVSYVGGYAIWLPYGVLAHSFPLIIADGVGLVCGIITLVCTLTYRGACQPVRRINNG